MTTPRCPFCNAQGIENITAKKLGPITLIHCAQCGAIHGVIPTPHGKKSHAEEPEESEAQETEPEPEQEELTPGEQAMVMGFYGQSTRYMKFPTIEEEPKK